MKTIKVQMDELHVVESPIDEYDESLDVPATDEVICRDTTREALEILLGMNTQSISMSSPGMEGPSMDDEQEEDEPDIVKAARSFREKLTKEGIL